MSLEVQQHRLAAALEALERRWDESGRHWRDAVREEFARKYWLSLRPLVSNSLGALEKLNQAMSRCRKDCS